MRICKMISVITIKDSLQVLKNRTNKKCWFKQQSQSTIPVILNLRNWGKYSFAKGTIGTVKNLTILVHVRNLLLPRLCPFCNSASDVLRVPLSECVPPSLRHTLAASSWMTLRFHVHSGNDVRTVRKDNSVKWVYWCSASFDNCLSTC